MCLWPVGSRNGFGQRSGGIFNSVKFHKGKTSMAASSSSTKRECRQGHCSTYSSLDKVVEALTRAGLDLCCLIIGIHFTKSNYGAGDPYERAISIIEKTLEPYDVNNLYPCFGFGDGQEVFSFKDDHSPCKGIKEVLACYQSIVPNVKLSGATSYAPVIDAAVDIVERRCGQFHALVLVADIQITNSFFNRSNGKLSSEGVQTITSIVNASSYPLSIILVGVGDGSWEHMKKFQDKIPKRNFDNFQFVSFTDTENCTSRDATLAMKEAAFAFAALEKTPLQFRAADDLDLIGNITRIAGKIVPRGPPVPPTNRVPVPSEQRGLSDPSPDYRCLQKVTDALLKALETSNVIVAIDFTKSNEWTDNLSFNNRNLHAIGDTSNPYEKVISLLGKTFAPFQKDYLIHCFGFGDVTTHDHEVFSFHGDHSPCYGFEEALVCYKRIVRNVELAGRASFAPVIEAAVDVVEKSGGQYHVLVIIAAGQVTRSSSTCNTRLSPQEEGTIRAIADASSYPLFIIVVGVGDGPWADMKKFDDKIPMHNNFQFVNFTNVMSMHSTTSENETAFSHAAFLEVPMHYMAAVECGIVGRTTGKANHIIPRPPPVPLTRCSQPTGESSDHSACVVDYRKQMICPICMTNVKDLALGCGHTICRDCGSKLTNCPICRKQIESRLKLYL